MNLKKCIVVEDDLGLAKQLEQLLELSHFQVQIYHTAEEFLLRQPSLPPCIYLIDLNLSGIKGVELIKLIRYQDKISPIYILSGAILESEISGCLKHGADDFLLKPYNPDHLILKLLNAQAKTNLILKNMINVGVKLVPEANLVVHEGMKIKLTNREYTILEALITEPEAIHSREVLVSRMGEKEITDRTIDVHVSSLRKKMEQVKIGIETCRGRGYRILINPAMTAKTAA